MIFQGAPGEALIDETPLLDIEGAFRASKTTLGLWKILKACRTYPGIHTLISRWTDEAADGILRPHFERICAEAYIQLAWRGSEGYYETPNGSLVYATGLKASEGATRYIKFRGRDLAMIYIDQAEEVPHDVFTELQGRLSQKGFPHQLILTPNPPSEDHWIADEFPEANNIIGHKYIRLSVYDNAQNLDPDYLASLEAAYPPGHPKHGPAILGTRGLNVSGKAVYAGAFRRELHVRPTILNKQLPLLEVLDFGKHHPCVLWSQFDPWGGWTWLGGIMGQDMALGDFCGLLQNYRQTWFPNPLAIQWACDPAGTHDNSHGTNTAISVLRERGIFPAWVETSNSPAVRRGCIERMAEVMRRRTAVGEAFSVDDRRWLVISPRQVRETAFAVQALEAGYVWDERSRTTAGGKSIVVPLKDGWFEHVMNCAEYTELNFGRGAMSVLQMEQQASKLASAALRRAQKDDESFRWNQRQSAGRSGY